ncbi:hypothetical protein BLOT_007898 [Blomia tropicalis]|nr:hypothetical protein BLOT_007898 [Blomia tropicalis]
MFDPKPVGSIVHCLCLCCTCFERCPSIFFFSSGISTHLTHYNWHRTELNDRHEYNREHR